MNALELSLQNAVICLLVGSIFSFLIPKGRLEEGIRFLLSICFLLSMLQPFGQHSFSVSSFLREVFEPVEVTANTSAEENLTDACMGLYQTMIKEDILFLLNQQNISAEVYLSVHNPSGQRIEIKQILLVLKDPNTTEKAVRLMEEEYQITPIIKENYDAVS